MVHQHHDDVIRPLIRAERLRRMLEIGVGPGRHTRQLLEALDPIGGRLTSVDPHVRPRLRLRTLLNRRIRFLRTTSLDALPRLRAACERFDCAIIDGDHNWYTVFHELLALRELVEPHGVILLHDVAWPFARRDMYYAPERIPAEYRHPYARRGIIEGQSALADEGAAGAHARGFNARHEGGPRNGVLTAIEDFIAARGADGWELRVIPGSHGLGILRRKHSVPA
jgi:predicted O-methyltransferase YrrM